MRKRSLLMILAVMLLSMSVFAHVDGRPSFQDAMAGVIARLRESHDYSELRRMRESDIEAFLTAEEKKTLATEYVSFDVNVPAVIHIAVHERQDAPYWLEQEGFRKTSDLIVVHGQDFVIWEKKAAKGHVGLGVSSFDGYQPHYFAIVSPAKKRDELEITSLYPGQHRETTLKVGARPYRDEGEWQVESLPEDLEGQTLIQMIADRNEESQLARIFRETPYPTTEKPDQLILTWGEDARNEVTVQWRTSTAVTDGVVRYQPAEGTEAEKVAVMTTLTDPYLANDAVNNRFTAELEGLKPGTTYTYRAGSPEKDLWSAEAEFTTAPDGAEPFSFVYMGDAQNGLDDWGTLVLKAYTEHPEAAFYVMAGDLVNRGNDRDDWDSLFRNAAGIYDRRPVVPAIGNHECQGDEGPWMYLSLFDLPDNGPADQEKERAYTVRYSNALIVVLDSNLPAKAQADWLEKQLSETDATWKFVVYHHPAYSSAPERDNYMVRKYWGALFDKYHVDMALQGHDHAYLRTWPMKDEKQVDSTSEGTIYVVSVSGTKYYKQGEFDYAEKAMANLSTFQVLDIKVEGNRMTYRAYDGDGNIVDEVLFEK